MATVLLKAMKLNIFVCELNFHLRVYFIELSEFFSMLGADITKKLLGKE